MEEEENTRCLFCEKEIPPVVVGLSSEDKEGRKEGGKRVPGFWRLCELLNVQVTPNDLKKLSSVPSIISDRESCGGGEGGGCDKILCSRCFGCVDKLSKLYEEMESIRKKIVEVVIAHLTEKSVEGSLEDNASRNGRGGRSKMITPVDFGEMFRNLVKQRVQSLPEPFGGGPGRPSKTQTQITSKRKRVTKKEAIIPLQKRKTRSSKKVTSENDPEQELVLKLEVDLEDAELWPTALVKPEVDQDEVDQANDSDYVPFDDLENYGDEEEPTPSPQQSSASEVEATNNDEDNRNADNREIKITSKKTPLAALKSRKKSRFHDSSSATSPSKIKRRLKKQPPTEFPCHYCDATFPTIEKRRHHQRSQHRTLPTKVYFKCDICSEFGFKSREDLTTHLKSHSGVTRVHLCKSCPMATSTLDKLLEHMVSSHARHPIPTKTLTCPECPNFVTDSSKSLYLHCSEAHPSLKQKFDCHLCQKSFLARPILRAHLQTYHPPEPTQFLCTICTNGKNYATKSVLDRHILVCHSAASNLRFKCDQCDHSFVYKSLLQSHIDEKHKRIRYPCPHCSKSYSSRRHRDVHIRTHTGEGLFVCDACGKQFPSAVQLKIHSVVHAKNDEQIKCVCEICGKSFPNQLRLTKHKNSHKEKSLECEYCHMMFGRRDNLKAHLRTHTGERPYVCPECSKGFNRRDILIVHMKMHGFGEYEEASKVYDSHVEKMKAETVQ